jgi:hypothetical protein
MQRFEDAVMATATLPMSTQYGEGSVLGEKVAGKWEREQTARAVGWPSRGKGRQEPWTKGAYR